MPRYINGFLYLTQCLRRKNYIGIEVINERQIINKKFLSTNLKISNKNNKNNLSNDNINKNLLINDKLKLENQNIIDENYEWCDVPADKIKLPNALDICNEDISEYVTPYIKPTFNFAAYANKSSMIQELIKLGVELYKLECKPKAMEILLQCNFDDIKSYIQFLHDCGVPPDKIGKSLTINPFILKQDLDDLRTRIRYLRAHNFSRNDIAKIITNNPLWLNYSTIKIDERLAFFQTEFKLSGHHTRLLAVTEPRLITYKHMNVIENTFSIREEMGFDDKQIQLILLNKPKLWMKGRQFIVAVFDYAHNVMNLSHDIIAQQPEILYANIDLVKSRHEFLKLLKRNQYDPKKPLYVSPDGICSGTDYEFCINVAKVSIELYDMFLKTR